MDKETDSNATLKPLWILNDWLRLIKTSNLPVDQAEIEKLLNPPLESAELVKKIFRDRILQVEKSNLINTTVGTPDFLSVSFLPKAVKRSLAVCRILQDFSRQEFIQLIEYAQGLNESQNFDTPQKVQEIFSIPAQYATDIFGDIYSNPSEEKPAPLEQLKLYIADVHNELAESRLAKLNPFAIGTGFLVGGNHLLTNQHVLPTQEVARRCIAQFNYAEGEEGNILVPVEYEFDPDVLFVSNEDLDYTLIELRSNIFKKQAGYEFGWIELVESNENIAPGLSANTLEKLGVSKDSLNDFLNANLRDLEALGYNDKDKSIPGDPVIIVQHPRGRRKQVVATNNRVIDNGIYKNFLRYTADSEPGASGSPVFNTNWQLVALNHASIPDTSTKKIIAEQGVRTCRIIEDLKLKSLNYKKLQSFIQDYVVTSEQLNLPPLSSPDLEFNGTYNYCIDVSKYSNIQDENSISEMILFASASSDGKIQLWGQNYVEPTYTLDAHSGMITNIVFSSDAQALLSAGEDGKIKLWNLSDKSFYSFDNVGTVKSLCLSLNNQLLAAGNSDGKIYVWQLDQNFKPRSSEPWKILEHERVHSLSFSYDTKLLASSGSNNKISIWNIRENEIEIFKLLDHEGCSPGLRFLSTQDKKILVSIGQKVYQNFGLRPAHVERAMKFWDLESDSWTSVRNDRIVQALIPIPSAEDLVLLMGSYGVSRISSSGQNIAYTYGNNILLLGSTNWENTFNEYAECLFEAHENRLIDIDFNSEGELLMSADEKGCAKFWTIYTDKPLKVFNYSNSFVKASVNPQITLRDLGLRDPYSFEQGQPFSLEAWVLIDAAYYGSEASGLRRFDSEKRSIISKSYLDSYGTFDPNRGEYALYIEGQELVFTIFLRDKNKYLFVQTQDKENMSFGTLKNGVFYHVAAVYSGQDQVELYINGELVQNPNKVESDASFKIINNLIPIAIGGCPSEPGQLKQPGNLKRQNVANSFKGRIAEVRIWSKALSVDAIRDRMYARLNGAEDHLVGYWKLDEGNYILRPKENQSTSFFLLESEDTSNSSFREYEENLSPQWSKARDYPLLPLPAGILCEKESFVQCNNLNWSSDTSSQSIIAITVEVWVKHLFGDVVIVSQGGLERKTGYTLSWIGNRIRVALQNIVHEGTSEEKQGEVGIFETANYAPTDKVWHHIAFTWSKATTESEIYIDGIRQNILPIEGDSEAVAIGGQYKSVGKFSSALFTERSNSEDPKIKPTLYIGCGFADGANFQCCISEVRIWKKARTQEQIRRNMYQRLELLILSEPEQSSSIDFQKENLVAYWRLDDGGRTNTRVRNLILDEGYGEIQGQAKWFPEPPEIIKEPDEQSPEN